MMIKIKIKLEGSNLQWSGEKTGRTFNLLLLSGSGYGFEYWLAWAQLWFGLNNWSGPSGLDFVSECGLSGMGGSVDGLCLVLPVGLG